MQNLLNNHIRVFSAIVEAGSITGAANVLNMGKSGVSESLKQLESSLGIQLLTRTTRRQSLTPLGEHFYKRCRELNELSKQTLNEISEHLAEPMGSMRITAPHATVQYAIAPAIAQLLALYPRLEPELVVDDERLDLIQHKIDLAITVGELQDSEFKAVAVGTLKDVLCASPQFCERMGIDPTNGLTPSIANGMPYVAHHWEREQSRYKLRHKTTGRMAEFTFQRAALANSVHAVQALLEEGVGIGVLPHFYLRDCVSSGRLVELFPGYAPRTNRVFAIHPYGNFPPVNVRVMMDSLKAALSGTN